MTYPLFPGIPFTDMGSLVDGVAVSACLGSGMIVVVEVDNRGYVAGLTGAYMYRGEAWNAYNLVSMDDRYAIIVPGENGAAMYYGHITAEELDNACSL